MFVVTTKHNVCRLNLIILFSKATKLAWRPVGKVFAYLLETKSRTLFYRFNDGSESASSIIDVYVDAAFKVLRKKN
jgi:hypothetical protein